MRLVLLATSGLVLLAGFQLFVLTEQTDRYFAWTIQPPLTAAFLGAGYWAGFPLVFLACRERSWSRARIAIPAVWLFTTLTLLATMLHLDRFHLNSADATASFAAWFWLAIYILISPAMLVLLIRQLRMPGVDAPRQAPYPTWLRLTLSLQSAVMIGIGIGLFVAPQLVASIWPWKLTQLTGQAVGAWFVGVGVFTGHLAKENDFALKAGMVSFATFGLLQSLALGRYVNDLEWVKPMTWVYIAIVISVLLVSLYGLVRQTEKH